MSQVLSESDILYIQRTCSCCGIYDGPQDGKWNAAIDAAEGVLASESTKIQHDIGTFDPRSERAIKSLMLPTQRSARLFMKVAAQLDETVRIISGTRTYAEQDALYAIGRTIQKNRKPVTNAKGGRSNHNFGMAWDVGIFDASGRYMTGTLTGDDAAYRKLSVMINAALPDIEWGGNWKTFPDLPHYQFTGKRTITELRALFEAGEIIR